MSPDDFVAADVRRVVASRASWYFMVHLGGPSEVRLEQNMFIDCTSLTEIDLSGIRGQIIIDNPFPNCTSLHCIRLHRDAVKANAGILSILKSRECVPPTPIEVVDETSAPSLK
jgi:hypothetical protein